KQVLGYTHAGEVWSTYCAARGNGTASFCTIERGGVVLLVADYTLHAVPAPKRPGSAAPAHLALAVPATTHLSGGQRWAAPVLLARLRALVLQAVAQALTG